MLRSKLWSGGVLRQAPRLTVMVLFCPVLAGVLGTVVPAFGNEFAGLQAAIGWTGFWPSLWLSAKTGIVSTAIAVIISFLIVAALNGTRSFRLIQHLLAPLLAVPHAAAALGMAFLITPSGWIARAISPALTGWTQPPDLLILNDPGGWSLILGLIAKEVPFLLLMTLAALPQTDAARRVLQAQTLGAGRMTAFVVAVLPALYRQVRLPIYAVLAYAMTTVEMAIILGPTLPPTLSVQIVEWMNDPLLTNRPTAAGAALIQLLAVLAAITALRSLEWAGAALLRRLTYLGPRGLWMDAPARLFGTLLGLGLSGLVMIGLLSLALWSVTTMWTFPNAWPNGLTLRTWMQFGPPIVETAGLTLWIACASTVIALALVLACLEAESRFGLQPGKSLLILYLPLVIPQVAFLPGLQVFALSVGLDGTVATVIATHLIFVLPYVFLSLSGPFRSRDGRLALVASSLGASPNRVFWTITLPVLFRPILTAAAVGIAVSIGQYLPTLLAGGGRVETLTTEAVALTSGGNRKLIGAYGIAQTLLPVVGFALAIALPNLVFRNRRSMGTSS